jgi:nitrite reductase (NADH) large subunit
MEGGMSYLKNVILNDSLGICDQLEEEMQLLVDSFHCEWKEVVQNEDLRKRFVHFVNAPEEKDPSVNFDLMREQIKAKEW